MFLDEAKINVKGGDGGNGLVSFHNMKGNKKRIASGGNGGKGGNVIIRADSGISTLYKFKKTVHFKGGNGKHGMPNSRSGRNGEDNIIIVPEGTLIKEDSQVVADLDITGKQIIISRGGIGGRGNASFISQKRRFPGFAEFGESIEERWIQLELRLVADAALVGFPNAGKSTLISRVSAAKPKIADYPFTTINPNLGVAVINDESFTIADVPGLIEGAHKGVGLGDKFLRHITRCKIIVFVLDGADILIDRDKIKENYRILRKELKLFSNKLYQKKYIVVLNKIDLIPDKDLLDEIKGDLEKTSGCKVMAISCATNKGIEEFLWELYNRMQQHEEDEEIADTEKKIYRVYDIDSMDDGETDLYNLDLVEDDGEYIVRNKKLVRLVNMTDLENEEALDYLKNRLKKMGIGDRLKKMGVSTGSTIIIGNLAFELQD